jgi:hypothetical protein
MWPRLYADQIPQLWRLGAVIIADHTRGTAGIRHSIASGISRELIIGMHGVCPEAKAVAQSAYSGGI